MTWLAPMIGVALGLLGYVLTGHVPRWISAGLLFYAPCLGAAFAIAGRSGAPDSPTRDGAPGGRALPILAFLVFWGAGVYVTKTIGEHAGDEGHYLVQAESLWRDGDLDIRNNLGREVTDADREHFHISATARDGRWYSWHPYGPSLLLAPTVPLGIVARHAVLALISALGVWLMLDLSRRYGASARGSLVAVGLVSASLPWVVYSVRCLPEVLGATLLLAIVWSTEAQGDRPRLAALAAGLATGFLPFAHTRFAPIGLAALAMSCGLLLLRAPVWREAVRPILLRIGIAGASLVVYAILQFRMFEGGLSYPLKDALLAYPEGMWYALASDRGLMFVLPFLAVLIAAPVVVAIRSPAHRGVVLNAMALVAVTLVSSCSNIWFHGGITLPGRYALVLVPLLVPLACVAIDSAPRAGRVWAAFLGLVSVGLAVLLATGLPLYGRDFTLMPFLLGLRVPELRDLPMPFMMPLPGSIHIAAAVLILVTGVLLSAVAKRWWVTALALAIYLVPAAMTATKRAEIWNAYFGPQIERDENHRSTPRNTDSRRQDQRP